MLCKGLLQQTITWYKICHARGQAHYYSRTGTSKLRQVKLYWFGSLCFMMSQCGNNHELALQHGGFPTMWSFVAKGLILHSINQNYIQYLAFVFNKPKLYLVLCVCIQKTKLTSHAWVWGIEAKYASSVWLKAIFANRIERSLNTNCWDDDSEH